MSRPPAKGFEGRWRAERMRRRLTGLDDFKDYAMVDGLLHPLINLSPKRSVRKALRRVGIQTLLGDALPLEVIAVTLVFWGTPRFGVGQNVGIGWFEQGREWAWLGTGTTRTVEVRPSYLRDSETLIQADVRIGEANPWNA